MMYLSGMAELIACAGIKAGVIDRVAVIVKTKMKDNSLVCCTIVTSQSIH